MSPRYWDPLLPSWSSQANLGLFTIPQNPAHFLQAQSLEDKYLTFPLYFPNLHEPQFGGQVDNSQGIISQVALHLDACSPLNEKRGGT